MLGLMMLIQERLRTIQEVRDADVFFSLDPDIIPVSAGFPCIGIKDGPVTRHDLTGGVTELTMNVDIIVYEKVARDEMSVRTVLGLVRKIHDALDAFMLDDYVKEADPVNETPISLMYREKALILRKTIPYQYAMEV